MSSSTATYAWNYRPRHRKNGSAPEVLGDVLERLGIRPLCESEWGLYERSARQPRRPIPPEEMRTWETDGAPTPVIDLSQWFDRFLEARAEAVR